MGTIVERPPFSIFIDRAQKPHDANVHAVLSRARKAWEDLVGHLEETYSLKGSLHFMYGPRYGWALRFERGGRLVLALYPNRGYLIVQIILSIPQVSAAIAMGLPLFVLKVLEAAKKYPEGRWLFIPVKSLSAARELRPLIELKISRPPIQASH